MSSRPVYVPILKGKEGEFAALEELAGDVRTALMPVIETPAIPFDHAVGKPAKSLTEHVSGIPDRLKRSCGRRPFFLDLSSLDNGVRLDHGGNVSAGILSGCSNAELDVVPVILTSSTQEHLTAVANHHLSTGSALAVRLVVEDFREEVETDSEVDRIIARLGLPEATSADLIIDLKDLGSDLGRATLIARSILSMIPRKHEWRNIILAAASFPEDLSDVNAESTSLLPRLEWQLWKALQRKPASLPRRDLIFGDYSIAHPVTKELDPRKMRMSASIRYTTADDWLILKARNVRQYGFDQYFELCRLLTERPEYAGRDFSWGDRYISDCVEGTQGPGNATTWRKVGVNHHLTLVLEQIANSHREP
ncbi:hypothetical protein HDF16_003409 [Granulicella aggregans]|uniref:T4 beta protein n=1 Tax=Granulicella aggregans TaxID=474949 RepID=A0A7W7ZEW7_9BACT|nr:beta family protein [Granulicella aggregans]MBB5058695.1 hypothetical protein [Granulicella aggregans]